MTYFRRYAVACCQWRERVAEGGVIQSVLDRWLTECCGCQIINCGYRLHSGNLPDVVLDWLYDKSGRKWEFSRGSWICRGVQSVSHTEVSNYGRKRIG